MVALLHPNTLSAPAPRGHHVPAGQRVPASQRSHLRLVQGGQAQSSVADLPWASIAVGTVVILFVGFVLAIRLLTGTPPATDWNSLGAGAEATSTTSVYVVAEGDTIWSIAEAVAPSGDRDVVGQQLIALNGSANLQTGDTLLIPANFGG